MILCSSDVSFHFGHLMARRCSSVRRILVRQIPSDFLKSLHAPPPSRSDDFYKFNGRLHFDFLYSRNVNLVIRFAYRGGLEQGMLYTVCIRGDTYCPQICSTDSKGNQCYGLHVVRTGMHKVEIHVFLFWVIPKSYDLYHFCPENSLLKLDRYE